MEAYLDNAATTKVAKEVRDIMMQVMEEDYGNPSSKHVKGMQAEEYLENAREIIAKTLKCEAKNITFTSGGTEANNQALIGTAFANERKGKHIISTVFEHASVHEPLIFLESRGFEVTYLPVNKDGILETHVLEEAVREDTILVSVMCVNNEIGSIQNIEELVSIVKKINPTVVFHVDAIQAYGKFRLYPKKWKVDLMSASAHKFHGPKGTGFLYHADGVKMNPYIYGGGQEKGVRSGTENVPGIAGLGKAAEIMYDKFSDIHKNMLLVKQTLIDGINDMEEAHINANDNLKAETGAPHILSVSFEGVKSEVLLHALAADGVYVSSGSACSSNHPQLSGTLKAIGVRNDLLDSTIRFSLSSESTVEEAKYAVDMLKKHVPVLKQYKSY